MKLKIFIHLKESTLQTFKFQDVHFVKFLNLKALLLQIAKFRAVHCLANCSIWNLPVQIFPNFRISVLCEFSNFKSLILQIPKLQSVHILQIPNFETLHLPDFQISKPPLSKIPKCLRSIHCDKYRNLESFRYPTSSKTLTSLSRSRAGNLDVKRIDDRSWKRSYERRSVGGREMRVGWQ